MVAGALWFAATGPAAAEAIGVELSNPAPAGARLPRLSSLANGGVLLSWVDGTPDDQALRYAVRRGGEWGAVREAARGGRWFINWADFPSVEPVDPGFWVAHWRQRQPGGGAYDYDIALAVSTDAGDTWKRAGKPHRDSGLAEHGFVSVFRHGDAAGLVWLDGRDYVSEADRAKHPEKSGNFALRFASVDRRGELSPETVIDPNVCTCCPTAAAATPAGPLLAYRARRKGEIRDNHVVRGRGGAWSAPAVLGGEGWHFAGCPTNGPALAVRGKQVIATWFTAEGDRPRIRAAVSRDSGGRFGPAIDIDAADPMGRASVAWLDDRSAAVAWLGTPDATTRKVGLLVRRISADGRKGSVVRVAEVDAGRDVGMPQIAVIGGALLLAWTESGPAYGIRTALVDAAVLAGEGQRAR